MQRSPSLPYPPHQAVLKVKFLINHKSKQPHLMEWGWVLDQSLLALQQAEKLPTIYYAI